ncbi:MAG TPA: hypothetical protein VGR62_10870 [Candidatus Binatia bacterium]|nr:hypothetical protein [Candidatus Binatia bacterium]
MRALSLLVAASVVVVGCSTTPPPPPFPTGIGQLSLRHDATTLARIAAEDEPTGSLARRRDVVNDVSRQLLTTPPDDALVPELFDLLAAMAPRMESGTISPAWGGYIFTAYRQDLLTNRPTGSPRRSGADLETALDGYVEFFALRARDTQGAPSAEDAAFEATKAWRDQHRLGR